jgi:DNA-binding NtrC family response regulator
VIGREPGPDGIPIGDDLASRQHAEIVYSPELDAYRVRDLGSKNGTFLNGARIDVEHLAPSSVLRIGDSLFVYAEVVLPAELRDFSPPPETSLARAYAEHLADLAAPSDLPVLILGPTGAGKERLAARVHAASGRVGQLVPINCATLNRDLLGSELFGHTKGAFSGAQSERKGLFASAQNGTLFLDEIAELPLDQQPALLRALQERRVRPVGADREISVDVRIVAATARNLDQLEESGDFREDLLARLSGLRINLAGLAGRREEILSLFSSFLGDGHPPLTTAAAERMLTYDWPKNVRELEHAAAGTKLFLRHVSSIDVSLLPSAVQSTEMETDAKQPSKPTRQHLIRLLEEAKGNVAEVARSLGEYRQQVYRWLEAYRLDPKDYRAPEDDKP